MGGVQIPAITAHSLKVVQRPTTTPPGQDRGGTGRQEGDAMASVYESFRLIWCTKMSDWYSIAKSQVVQAGGKKLFTYHASLRKALQHAFPEFEWQPHKFFKRGKPSIGTGIAALSKIEENLGIEKVCLTFMRLLL